MERSLVLILATREVLAPHKNDPIMLGNLILSFRLLKHQNLSTGDDFINCMEIYLVLFLTTKEALVPLASDLIMMGRLILSFRHLEHQNPSIISEDIGE